MDSYTNTSLYEAIFKRKSFHLFRGVGEDRLVQSELESIVAAWQRFRKDMFKAKRKPLNEIWSGDDPGIADIARFAPSACNTQPWYVENKDGILTVFRYRKPGKRGIMPEASVSYYNRIEMGIYLCIMEVCMLENGDRFEREVFPDAGGEEEFTKVAVYRLNMEKNRKADD